MIKTRIIKRTGPCGRVTFVIQQKHFIFFWWWVDAWINSSAGAACTDSWDTLEEAERKTFAILMVQSVKKLFANNVILYR